MSAELILSIVITLATISYTYINYRMLVESQESRLLKITPVIIPFFNTSENNSILVLHIKNIGEGLAKNVKATIAEDYEMFGIEKYKLSEVGIFERGFEIFPPDLELKFNINMRRDSYKIDQANNMQLSSEYENNHG